MSEKHIKLFIILGIPALMVAGVFIAEHPQYGYIVFAAPIAFLRSKLKRDMLNPKIEREPEPPRHDLEPESRRLEDK